jgi:hypothetical protein
MSPITSNYKASDLGNPFAGTGEVTLPFPHLRLFWHNGDGKAALNSGVYHYGGWFSGQDDMNSDLSEWGIKPDMLGFSGPDTWVNNKGKEYQAYHNRQIYIAPIAPRVTWRKIKKDDGSWTSKSTYALLCWLAYPADKTMKYLGPAVISGSSYSGGAIEDAIKSYPGITAKARAEAAPDVPSWQWYIPIGTFGNKRIQVVVGKGAKQSPIVPAQIFVPDGGWTAEKVAHYFVPNEQVQQIMDTKKAAEEWLAWKPSGEATQPTTQPTDDFPDV